MSTFISYIVTFLRDIRAGIGDGIRVILGYDVYDLYNAFLQKNVFLNNSFVGLNFTWYEFFIFIGIWFLTFLSIYLFIRFICKIFSIFRV